MDEQVAAALRAKWDSLLREGKELTFKKGQVLCYEGHAFCGLFVLQSGEVRFTHTDRHGKRSCKGEHLSTIEQDKVIGLEHFFSDAPCCCTCIAESDCKLIFISRSLLKPLIETDTN